MINKYSIWFVLGIYGVRKGVMVFLFVLYVMKVRESYIVNIVLICVYFFLLKIYCKDFVIVVIVFYEISLVDLEMFL